MLSGFQLSSGISRCASIEAAMPESCGGMIWTPFDPTYGDCPSLSHGGECFN